MLSLIVLFAGSLFAAERPPIPKPEVDLEVTGGLTPREYFAKRKENKPCREALAKAKEAEAKAPAAQKKALHQAYLDKVIECGDCNIVPPGPPIVVGEDTASPETWYVSYGFCQLDLKGDDFKNLSDSLLDLKKYPAKSGGFSHIAEFIGYKEGTATPIQVATVSPFDAAIAVKGRVLAGALTGAIGYFVKNEFAQEKDYFHLTFENTDSPPGYKFPKLTTEQGFPLPLVRLSHANGSWFLTKDGYFRYYTAADFPGVLSFASSVAKEILLDTLLEFYDRAEGANR